MLLRQSSKSRHAHGKSSEANQNKSFLLEWRAGSRGPSRCPQRGATGVSLVRTAFEDQVWFPPYNRTLRVSPLGDIFCRSGGSAYPSPPPGIMSPLQRHDQVQCIV